MSTPSVVLKTDTANSWKTTVGGLVVALGLVIDHIREHGIPEDLGGWIGLLMKAVGPAVLGWFARDKNVTSEGHKVVAPVDPRNP